MNEQQEFEAWWDQDIDTTMNPYSHESKMRWAWEAWKAGRAAEREACAKIADHGADMEDPFCCQPVANCIAKDIRARGQDV